MSALLWGCAVSVVAAFDFDGTLTRGDTLLPYLRRSLGWPHFLVVLCVSAPWIVAYLCGVMSNERAKARLLKRSFAGRSVAQVSAWTGDFALHYLPNHYNTWMLDRLRGHQDAGHRCVLISASPDVYVHQAAAALGFDAVICTELQVQGECYSGELATPNCYGEQKAQRLQAWLAGQDVTLYAYGDTPGDYPLLRLADEAWYRGKPWFSLSRGIARTKL